MIDYKLKYHFDDLITHNDGDSFDKVTVGYDYYPVGRTQTHRRFLLCCGRRADCFLLGNSRSRLLLCRNCRHHCV